MRRLDLVAATALIFALAACGSTQTPPRKVPRKAWAENATILVNQLQRDLLLAANGGATVATARHALHDESDLYTILVAYTDFGGCSGMLANVGAPPNGLGSAGTAITAACRLLERAASLFTRATTHSSPAALVAASRISLEAEPFLYRAKNDLNRQG